MPVCDVFMILPFFVVLMQYKMSMVHYYTVQNHYFGFIGHFQQQMQSWIGNKEYVAQKNATDKCS